MKKLFLVILTLYTMPSLCSIYTPHSLCANPIRDAICTGDITLLESVLASYTDSNKLSEDITDNCYYAGAPILVAAHLGHWKMVKLLLTHGAEKGVWAIRLTLRRALTARELERKEKVEIIDLLLQKGAPLPSVGDIRWLLNKFGKYPLPNVRRYALLEPLINHGFNINEDDGHATLLDSAIERNNYGEIYYLLMNGADKSINRQVKKYDATPFLLAVKHGFIKIADLLLIFGADINKKGATLHYSPIHMACDRDNLDMLKFLIKKGGKNIDFNCLSVGSYTPLNAAIRYNKTDDCALELLKNGAHQSINIMDRNNPSALHLGSTPLSQAIKRNNIKMAKLLLYLNASITHLITTLEPTDNTIKYLIANPQDIEACCSQEELKEFDAIRNCAIFSASGNNMYKKLHNNPNYLDVEFKFN